MLRLFNNSADNGCFADNALKRYCEDNKQLFTYCVVNVYFHDRITEQANQQRARKSPVHAIKYSPRVMDLILLPHVSFYVVFLHNYLPFQDDDRSKLNFLETFS